MFNVTKNKLWFTLIPVVIIVAGILGFFVNGGFRQDIDFAGGTSVELGMGKVLTGDERAEIAKLYKDAAGIEIEPTVQLTGTGSKNVVIKSTVLAAEKRDAAIKAVADKFGLDAEAATLSTATQAATYGNEMKTRTLMFTLLASVLMLIYIWIRFEWRSGVMAVLCLILNVLVMMSVYAIGKIPLSTTFIAALLTVVGYSINDTIVIFDRIRENRKFAKKSSATEVVEKSIWQSMTRTINTSITTLITLVVLYFMGASSLKNFALPIIIGIICGSFTSIFIASPWWGAWCDANKKAVK